LSAGPCSCDSQRSAMRLVRLFAWRARYLQLIHTCPPAANEKGRREWDRRLRVARAKLERLEGR
jgi:hypothetical protein